MRRNRLGRTSLVVTELGFGAAPLGNMFTEMSDDNAVATVEAAWRGGVRYFDTAPHYGLGLSETRLGRVLAEHRRGEFVVSTKVGRLLVPNDAPTGTDLASGGFAVPGRLKREWDFSADGVRRSLDASLARLGLDRVDIVLVHDPDDFLEPAMSKAIPALIALREQGVIGAVGVGMNQWQAPLRIVQETARHRDARRPLDLAGSNRTTSARRLRRSRRQRPRGRPAQLRSAGPAVAGGRRNLRIRAGNG